MKRKLMNRDIWTDITKKRYIQKEMDNDDYKGIIALLYIDDVVKPSIWNFPDKPVAVCDKGMKWLQYIPHNENYMVTVMYNSDNQINLWYIDIIGGYGFNKNGIAYYDDLYLDIILTPNGDLKIDDMDELVEAVNNNVITKELFDLAITTKDKLLIGYVNNIKELAEFCHKYLLIMETN